MRSVASRRISRVMPSFLTSYPVPQWAATLALVLVASLALIVATMM